MPDADRQFYADWVKRLRDTEGLPAELPAALEAAKGEIAELERRQTALRSRRDQLEFQIAATEAALNERTRRLLDVTE